MQQEGKGIGAAKAKGYRIRREIRSLQTEFKPTEPIEIRNHFSYDEKIITITQ